jgi:PAS domain-containing protein
MSSAEHRRSLEEAIVDTVREPLIVLDDALRVVVASRSFYRAFDATRQETEGRPLYELGSVAICSPLSRFIAANTPLRPRSSARDENGVTLMASTNLYKAA